MSDKVFRDPLYNYIAFDRGRDRWLIDLIDCPEVQRLRRIHQLGVSNFTYPGADHTRFAHSLGVTHLMKLVLEHLERSNDDEKIKNPRQALLATALLHDVGHGPFSHLFEPCLDIKHEHWSIAVVRDEASAVHKVLKKQNAYLPNHVADLIDSQNTTHPAWQRALMSSQLDVDRLDYLRRDSLFTGAGYGHFDWYRLLTTVQFYDTEMDLVWPEKSALAIEEYIFARYYMYQNVYLHKTTGGRGRSEAEPPANPGRGALSPNVRGLRLWLRPRPPRGQRVGQFGPSAEPGGIELVRRCFVSPS